MLNELYSLSETMNDMSIEADSWHRDYKSVPKGTTRLWISADNAVEGVESLDSELVSKLRKYGDNNNAFPGFNIPPLYRITDEQQIKKVKSIIKTPSELDMDEVKSWCINDNWPSSRRHTINKCLHKISLELLAIIQKYNLEETRSIVGLIQVVSKFPRDDGSYFRSSIESCVFKKLHLGENVEIALKLLFHSGNAKNLPKDDCGPIPVILDICEWRQYKYPIASEYTTYGINKALQMEESSKNNTVQSENKNFDAFGIQYEDLNEPMPAVKIPMLGNVTLRSMFHEHKCQYRYRMIDDVSYPIARQNRASTKQAIEWVADPKREDITWAKVDKNEIIVAYPSKMPELFKVVSCFAPPKDMESESGSRKFEETADDFMKTFKGMPPEKRPDNIHIFSIKKMDKARTKIIYSRNCSPDSLSRSAQEWQNGCSNIPTVPQIKQYTPFPLKIADIINNVWRQDGNKTIVRRMKYYQGMELLLDPLDESVFRHYLTLTLANSFGLINYFGNQEHRKEKCSNYFKDAISSIFSVLGLLLYKSNHRKEDYMEDTAYLVGQLLKVSDELHVLYSQIERSGSIPPQLAGNSMLIAISETPWRAIAVHGQRMLPYIAWAKRYRAKSEKNSWKAGWYLRLYEQFSTKLSDVLVNEIRFDEFGKAKLFIGYLAAFPVKEKPEISDDTDDSENINVKGEENE
jgi:hypothetical protein